MNNAAQFRVALTISFFRDVAHAAYVDNIEAGRRVSGQVRFAFEVPNLQDAMAAAR